MILSHAGERIQPSKDITIKYSNQDSIQQYNFFFHCITVWKILERSVCAIASCNADYIGECARCLNGWGKWSQQLRSKLPHGYTQYDVNTNQYPKIISKLLPTVLEISEALMIKHFTLPYTTVVLLFSFSAGWCRGCICLSKPAVF